MGMDLGRAIAEATVVKFLGDIRRIASVTQHIEVYNRSSKCD